jgi:hypothetical protein
VIRAVANKRLELSDSEYVYYNKLKEKFGEREFVDLFLTNKNGIITSISPPLDKQISFGVMFFILNIMMNQRLRSLEAGIKKVIDLENKIDILIAETNIVERIERLEEKKLEKQEEA